MISRTHIEMYPGANQQVFCPQSKRHTCMHAGVCVCVSIRVWLKLNKLNCHASHSLIAFGAIGVIQVVDPAPCALNNSLPQQTELNYYVSVRVLNQPENYVR